MRRGGIRPWRTDALDELGDEIATLAAHLHAATHRLLILIAEFDRRRGWDVEGFRTCAHWLSFRTKIDLGAAREKVRAARALERLPQVSAAMARGEVSFAQVRSLTRVAQPETEGELLEVAQKCTAAQLEQLVRGYRVSNRLDEAERERIRHRSRCLSVFPDNDGTYVVRGRLDPEVGALLMRAIEAASDALFRAEAPREVEPAQRRADAIGLLAERALAAGFGDDSTDDASKLPISGTRAERYQVMLNVEPATLEWARQDGRSELEDGTRVSAETSRRLSCDASVVRVQRGGDGSVLDVGRKTRTIPPALRRALDVRDRGCRFPGCGLRFTEGHHVIHWADHGPTSLANTLLLCRFHHRLVHEGGFRVEWVSGDRPNFYDRRGLPVPDDPPRTTLSDRAPETLKRWNQMRGVDPDYRTTSARYRREQDIPWPLIERAVAALDASVGL